jgi:hypothetical protein
VCSSDLKGSREQEEKKGGQAEGGMPQPGAGADHIIDIKA